MGKKKIIRFLTALTLMAAMAMTEIPASLGAIRAVGSGAEGGGIIEIGATAKAEAATALKAPSVSKKAGTYKDKVTVTIKNKNSKGTIYYTTNGKNPTSKSKKYTKALTFKKTTTLKAVCISGTKKSAVVTRKYAITKSDWVFQPMEESEDMTFSHVSKYINALAYDTVSALSQTDQKTCGRIKEILEEHITGEMTTEEKAKAIHDYIINQTVYDEKSYQTGTIPEISYTVNGVLLKKTAVCQGYAETYYLFMHLLDIPCKIITGTGNEGNHGWNLVKLSDGKWYHVDCTWDDPVMQDGSNVLSYDYLFANDKMMKADHKWTASDYPVCDGTKYLYYGYGDCKLDSVKDFESAVRKAYEEGKTEVTVLYPEKGRPDLNIVYKVTGVSKLSYVPEKRIGDYTIFTVIWG